jgi:hypothetical protein
MAEIGGSRAELADTRHDQNVGPRFNRTLLESCQDSNNKGRRYRSTTFEEG